MAFSPPLKQPHFQTLARQSQPPFFTGLNANSLRANTLIFSATPISETEIELNWDSSVYPDLIGFAISRSNTEGLLSFTNIASLGVVGSYIDSGLTSNTQYIYSLVPLTATGNYNSFRAMAATLVPQGATTVVTNDSEFLTAVADNSINDVRLAGGRVFTSAINNAFTGLNRVGNILNVRADSLINKPILNDVTFNFAGSRWVRHYGYNIFNNNVGGTIFGEGTNSLAESVQNVTVAYCDINGTPRRDILTSDPDIDYEAGMPNVFDYGGYWTGNNHVFGNKCKWVRQFGDFTANGDQIVADNFVDKWYFDHVRLLGQPDEGRLSGNTYFIHNGHKDNIARYEEGDGTFSFDPILQAFVLDPPGNGNEPHPDAWQVFNVGGTNPYVSNVMFLNNYAAQDLTLRAQNLESYSPAPRNYQWNLCQSNLRNVAYHENLALSDNSPHATWMDSGARGVLISKTTYASMSGGSEPEIRLNSNTSHVLVVDTIIPGGFSDSSSDVQSELEQRNVFSDRFNNSASETLFNGPLGVTQDENSIFQAFIPDVANSNQGALTQQGLFKGSLHVPTQADQPTLNGGAGQVALTSLPEPTLNSDLQAYLGGTTYSYDFRYTLTGTASWTTVSNVTQGQVLSSIAPGTYDGQHRCVNSEGQGVWSESVSFTVT